MAEYDVFISYRRDGGEHMAKIIQSQLSDMGFSVFLDTASLSSGKFDEALTANIENCRDFILILSKGSLERTLNDGDWLRTEIENALKSGKNIIPVFLKGFEFPDKLPPNIEQIRRINGIREDGDYFDAFIKKIIGFLCAKPNFVKKVKQNKLLKKITAITLAAILLISGGIYAFTKLRSFPYTEKDKNTVNDVATYVYSNLMKTGLAYDKFDIAVSLMKKCITEVDGETVAELYKAIAEADAAADSAKETLEPLGGELSELIRNTPISRTDVESMYTYVTSSMDSIKIYLREMSYAFFGGNIDASAYSEYVACLETISECDKQLIMIGANGIFIQVNRKASKQFREDMIPYLKGLDVESYEWSYSSEELDKRSEEIFVDYEAALQNMYAVYTTASCGRTIPEDTGLSLTEEITLWLTSFLEGQESE